MSDLERLEKAAADTHNLFQLDGKSALVIGGTKGLGQAMALGLAAAGADVCVAGRGPAGLAETADAIRRLGRKGTSFAADVTDESRVEELMSFMKETYGGIDILVNSQGIVHLQASTEFDTAAWQRVMDVNLKSLVLTCKYAGRYMLEKKRGKIINISSVRGFQGRAEDLAYAPSKGAVNQLTRSLAIEWGPKGINVNGIAPVFTLTAINRNLLSDPEKKNWVLSRIPMKRLGEMEDLMGPVIFLASDASDFVNGHTLPVDGGWLGA
ncbi:glucose 1-dehydrogenase [Marispirochaeta aestuarii]|uniref:SDR family NAD(P)-dependent oxidoreductase n=1 Tax=Marispirochaeta aestuarii TaxID=1963862 RepID=UPI0029C6329E|nr:glucose 1-dehydrogenase [Marispirochaeta aestuarii]